MKFRLKDFRQAHKMFQSELSELLEMNQSTVSRLELRGSCKMSFPQMQRLYERFGKEDVDSFMDKSDEVVSVEISGEAAETPGNSVDDNGTQESESVSMSIIRQQSEALTKIVAKQAEQTDRLIALLEKLQDKL